MRRRQSLQERGDWLSPEALVKLHEAHPPRSHGVQVALVLAVLVVVAVHYERREAQIPVREAIRVSGTPQATATDPTGLPCAIGEMLYFAGDKVYVCTATNTWTIAAPSPSGNISTAGTLTLGQGTVPSGFYMVESTGGGFSSSMVGNTIHVSGGSGTVTSGDCLAFDKSGNLIDSGGTCIGPSPTTLILGGLQK